MKLIHKKILPEYFNDVISGEKKFEIRKDDCNYQVGDILILEEWHGYYTGRFFLVTLTYILRNCPEYGLMDGYCILNW
jgi:hypothetical protein